MRSLHIENSYRIWSRLQMRNNIDFEWSQKNDIWLVMNPEDYLNRTYESMYVEWWLHNIGYYITLPFVKNNKVKALNERFKHVDLEEHI